MVIDRLLLRPPSPGEHDSTKCCEKRSLRDVISLCRVSKTLCAIAQPFLLTYLTLTDKNGLQVLHMLEAAPHLQPACKRLDVALAFNPESYNWNLFAYPIAYLLSHVRYLRLHSAPSFPVGDSQPWRFIHKLTTNSTSELEHLHLCKSAWLNEVATMINNLELMHLQTLSLDCSYFLINKFDPHHHSLSAQQRGTSSARSIAVRARSYDVRFVTGILSWPTAPEEFSFITTMLPNMAGGFSALMSALTLQAASLKRLEMFIIRDGEEHLMFDATEFPRLEIVCFSRWQLRKALKFTPTDANILGPAVRKITWGFSKYATLAWRHFSWREEAWLSALVEASVSRQAELQEIEIAYTPSTSFNYIALNGWLSDHPRDRIDRVRSKAMEGAIALTRNKPDFLRDGFALPCLGNKELQE